MMTEGRMHVADVVSASTGKRITQATDRKCQPSRGTLIGGHLYPELRKYVRLLAYTSYFY